MKQHTLPPAFHTAVTQSLFAFGLEGASWRVQKHGTTTTIRVLATSDARYALRLQLQSRMPLPVVLAELAWLQAIREATSLQVPQPVQTRDGQLAVLVAPESADPIIATCFAWLPGRHKRQLTRRDAGRMGAALGCLHQFSSRYSLPAGLERWDFNRDSFVDEHGTAIAERLGQLLDSSDWQAVQQAYAFTV
jgi:Ser/Thr protein kinase RdoA (MazF antagonist)